MRAPDHISKPASGVLMLAAVAILSMWSPLLAIAEEGTAPAEALADGDEVTDNSTAAMTDGVTADSAVAAANTLGGDEADGDGADEDVLTSEAVPPDENLIERSARAFTESELVFVRGLNNAPFLPVAFLGNTYYGDAMVSEEGATPETAGTAPPNCRATGCSSWSKRKCRSTSPCSRAPVVTISVYTRA